MAAAVVVVAVAAASAKAAAAAVATVVAAAAVAAAAAAVATAVARSQSVRARRARREGRREDGTLLRQGRRRSHVTDSLGQVANGSFSCRARLHSFGLDRALEATRPVPRRAEGPSGVGRAVRMR